jgi:hypothetical protein
MSKIDLLSVLPEKDKKIFHNYVTYFNNLPDSEFVGADNYLRYWAKDKIRL